MFFQGPIPQLLLDVIHTKNPRLKAFDCNAFTASKPRAIVGVNNTSVWIKGTGGSGLFGLFEIQYARTDISVLLRGFVPHISKTIRNSLSSIIEDINKTYGLNLLETEFEITESDDVHVVICAKLSSYLYCGSIHLFVVQVTVDSQLLVGDASGNSLVKNAELYSKSLSFASLGSLDKVLPMDNEENPSLSIAADALQMETLDPWKVTKKKNPYNLYGAKVLSNSVCSEGAPLVEGIDWRLLTIELNPSYCTNMQGILKLYYSHPEKD